MIMALPFSTSVCGRARCAHLLDDAFRLQLLQDALDCTVTQRRVIVEDLSVFELGHPGIFATLDVS